MCVFNIYIYVCVSIYYVFIHIYIIRYNERTSQYNGTLNGMMAVPWSCNPPRSSWLSSESPPKRRLFCTCLSSPRVKIGYPQWMVNTHRQKSVVPQSQQMEALSFTGKVH